MATPIPANHALIPREWLEAIAGRPLPALPASLRGTSTDSRALGAGSLFVALRGELHDGATFVPAALAAGAAACLVQGQSDGDPRVIAVDDTLRAWGELARLHLEALRRQGRRVVLVITGSAGKTTTKEMTAALLAGRGAVHATVGNLNNRIGLPATVLAAEAARADFLVLEAGMSLPGEMAELSRIAEPDLAAVINVGLAHAEGVGGRAGVLVEKSAVYTHLRADGVAVGLFDDDELWRATTRAPRRLGFGARVGAEYRLLNRTVDAHGHGLLTIERQGTALEVRSPFAGAAQALDVAAALALADLALQRLGQAQLTPPEIEAALARLVLEGRGERFALRGGGLLIDDSYNANPASMAHAVELLGELAFGRRRVLVLGEMRELGDFASDAHVELGEHLARAKPELVIGCGGLIDLALDRAAAAGVEVCHGTDAADAALLAQTRVMPEDCVLVKASRGVRAEQVVRVLRTNLSST